MDDDGAAAIERAMEADQDFRAVEEELVAVVEEVLIGRGETPTPFAMLAFAIDIEIDRVRIQETDPEPALRGLVALKSFAGALALRDTDGARA